MTAHPRRESRFQWWQLPTETDIEADYALTASLDPRMARESRQCWESRTVRELHILRDSAWLTNECETHCKAMFYLTRRLAP